MWRKWMRRRADADAESVVQTATAVSEGGRAETGAYDGSLGGEEQWELDENESVVEDDVEDGSIEDEQRDRCKAEQRSQPQSSRERRRQRRRGSQRRDEQGVEVTDRDRALAAAPTATVAPGRDAVADTVMCAVAFATLERHLRGKPGELLPKSIESRLVPDSNEYGVFVTWRKRHARESLLSGTDVYHLRGCIGTLTPTGLHEALRSYALTSALHDRRFAPIALDELPQLSCGVSLLHDFVRRESVWDWEPGVHGLILEVGDDRHSVRPPGRIVPTAFNPHSNYSATYLPEVAIELGWSRSETIRSLVRKSGYGGHIPADDRDEWWASCVSLTTYTSTKAGLKYEEYRAMLVQSLN
ncbi:hypothetical protein CDCA_CDCA01G0106 [Cyanidium caldarium]|uniref:AMMECR1 domain-containing protein n=1 Tax=Cyanidium caldarium TaxID=2771 RepID=A0AAV9IPE8_CYACA|nr:hypothetical protein CDCA_CDCA01G0106 [Cyanidium caldarium]